MAESLLINLAYALYVASGFVRTVARLRAALLVVSATFITWGLVAPNYPTVLWNLAFGSVHALQLYRQWRVERDGAVVAELGPDSIIGERSYLTGDEANATVRAATPVELHVWDQSKVAALDTLCPAAHDSLLRHISFVLASKL